MKPVGKAPMLLAFSAKKGTNIVKDPESNTSSETDAPKTSDDTKWDGSGGPLEAKPDFWQHLWE